MELNNSDILLQIEQQSPRIFFLYQLGARRFQALSQNIETVWEIPSDKVKENPEVLLDKLWSEELPYLTDAFNDLQKGEPVDLKIKLLLSDGLEKKIRVDAYPIKNTDGKVEAIAGFAEDVSGLLQYEDYLERYAHRKNTALELIVHDLRVPLAHVKSAAQLIESEIGTDSSGDSSSYTDIILKAYDQCIKLIQDVLADEHLNSPTIYVRKKQIDVRKEVKDLVDFYSTHESVGVEFELKAEGDLLANLDDTKFMQIINNLVSNSLKFTPPGGKITISIEKQANSLLLTHADTGIGIPEELHPHIFARYSKASRLGLNGEPTRGLGLSIVRELVEMQGGEIWFESAESKGTTFFLKFPLTK